MSDAIQTAILAAFSAALERAISQAVATHLEDLQTRLDALADRIDTAGGLADRMAKLETKLTEAHIFTQTSTVTVYDLEMLKVRLAKLESAPTDAAHEVAGLDDELLKIKARLAELESETQGENRYLNRQDVASLIEEAMDSHCSDYDHDDYDSHVSDDDKHFDGDIEDAVRDALSNMSFDVTIR